MTAGTLPTTVRDLIAERLAGRNEPSRRFFDRESARLAHACRDMAGRFERGGRLLAFGRGACATDAQHVAVEFVHPVIVGKRALPAMDLSIALSLGESLATLIRPEDIVMGFAPPAGDPAVAGALALAATRGAQTFALPGAQGSYWIPPPDPDPFLQQELIEILYHTLWETVHVFFEHREHGHDVGASAFLYPFLGAGRQDTTPLVEEVARSIRAKAADDERLRLEMAGRELDSVAAAVALIADRVSAGGSLLLFGNGGSATDANDWALDCVSPPEGLLPVPAISLAAEAATLTALANDIGREAIFQRQLIAHARPGDVAIGISTSGGSIAVIEALQEARRRNLATIALLGHDGSPIERQRLADVTVVVRCDYIPRIQEVQASVYHAMIEAVDAVRRGRIDGRGTAVDRGAEGPGPVSPPHRELFGTASCPYTAEMREHLESTGQPFVEYDVDTDAGARARLVRLTEGPLIVPVLLESGRITATGWRGRGCTIGPPGRSAP